MTFTKFYFRIILSPCGGMVDTRDLKFRFFGSASSSLAKGTNSSRYLLYVNILKKSFYTICVAKKHFFNIILLLNLSCLLAFACNLYYTLAKRTLLCGIVGFSLKLILNYMNIVDCLVKIMK